MPSRRGLHVAVVASLLALGAASRAAARPAPLPPAQPAPPQTSQSTAPKAPSPAQAATAPPGAPPPAYARPLFRVILNDGTALVSYGEFTRVGDRVVFSMPLDSPRGDRLQLVNLPASAVNCDPSPR